MGLTRDLPKVRKDHQVFCNNRTHVGKGHGRTVSVAPNVEPIANANLAVMKRLVVATECDDNAVTKRFALVLGVTTTQSPLDALGIANQDELQEKANAVVNMSLTIAMNMLRSKELHTLDPPRPHQPQPPPPPPPQQ